MSIVMFECVLFAAFIAIFLLICGWSLSSHQRRLDEAAEREKEIYRKYGYDVDNW